LQPETILVVEDNFDIRAMARTFLENAGYTVVTASDGEEGLRVYKRYQSGIGLLLTDVTMPKMNGLELVDRVLKLDSQQPVLFMSGNAPRVNGFGCVTKPFSSVELLDKVSQVLGASDKRSGDRIPSGDRARSAP
jgi:CheY-like chemotaxis protein